MMDSGRIPSRAFPRRGALPSILAATSLAWLLGAPVPVLEAREITADEQHFTATPGQTLFGVDELNVFKQFLFEWNPKPIGIGKIEDPTWFPGQYGGRVTYSTAGAFGLEFGLCLGGNVDFDLVFQPQIILPDRLVTGIGLPVTISAPQMAQSHFTTSFDGLGQAYADLILDARVGVDYRVCLVGCAGIGFGLDSGDLLAPSERCDPSINAINPPKAAIELASVNRGQNGIMRMLRADPSPIGGFLEFGYETNTPGTTNGSTVSLVGNVSLSNPSINTDSTDSIFCQSGIICSSGSADIFGLALDVGNFIDELLPSPRLPHPFEDFRFKLKNEFHYRGLSANYVLADLSVGPVVQLQMAHEMDWDLRVTAMTFSAPVKIEGNQVSSLSDLPPGVVPAGGYHLTNIGENALPMIELLDTNDVVVSLSYVVAPRFKTKVSTPIIGRINYELLSASVGFRSGPVDFGPHGVGPVVKGKKEFDVANVTAYSGQQTLQTPNVGTIAFTLRADGPPSFQWTGPSGGSWSVAANWTESSTGLQLIPTSTSDVAIPAGSVRLTEDTSIPSLCMGPAAQLFIERLNGSSPAPVFTISGGTVDNRGIIWLNQNATLGLESTNAVLGAGGNLVMAGGTVRGYTGSQNFTFVNYNVIQGGGSFMEQHSLNGGTSTMLNLSSITASEPALPLSLSANRIRNSSIIRSIGGSQISVQADALETTAGGSLSAQGLGSTSLLYVDRAEHAGVIEASAGGHLLILPQGPAEWNAGLAINGDKGRFHAVGAGSRITLDRNGLITLKGGCFQMADGGTLDSRNVRYIGSVLDVGTFDEAGSDASGFLVLSKTNVLESVCLNNYGTLSIPGEATVVGSKLFANHGTIDVPLGGSLRIPTISLDPRTQGASPEVLTRPGTINASANTLLGGTWWVRGTLLIEGASLATTGADPGSGSASSGYVDADGIAQPGNPADDITKVLSYGRPANVILDGPLWDFPAILPLADNGGRFSLANGATFAAAGSFTNRGKVLVDGNTGSWLSVPGSYVQVGTNALSMITRGGSLTSASGDYQILGGQVLAEKGAAVFGRVDSDTSLSGVSLQIASRLHWYTNQVGYFDAAPMPCVIDLSTDGVQGQLGTFTQIERIDADAAVILHGNNITFRDLTWYLRQVDGRLTVSGETFNQGLLSLRNDVNPFDPFFNNGAVEVLGQYSELTVSRDYVQNSGTTTVGRGAALTLSGDLTVTGGEFIIEIGSRSRARGEFNYSDGLVKLNGTENLGNSLKIRFIGLDGLDVGDSWTIIQGANAQLSGPVNYEGVTLPPFTQLVAIPENTGGTALRIAVVPDGPTLDYTEWLTAYSIPVDQWSPDLDFDNDGLSDGSEFLFGSDPTVADSAAVQPVQGGVVDDGNGGTLFEVTFERPAGVQLREAAYRVYLATNLTDLPIAWRQGLFSVVGITAGTTPDTQWVTLRSTTPFLTDALFARVGGRVLGYVPPAGSTPDDPLGDPGDLADQRGQVGKVIYYRIQGDETSAGGSVYGGPQYADRSSLKRTVVHAGAVPDTDNQYIVKVTILDGLPSYPAADGAFGLRSQALLNPEFGSVSFTVEAYP